MPRITMALLTAQILLQASLPAIAADRTPGRGEAALPLIRVADDDDDRDDDAERALAIVGTLMGLALLERAARDERRAEPEPPRAALPPEEVIAPPVRLEVPVRPAWIESLAQAPRLDPAPAAQPTSRVPTTGDAAVEELGAAPPPRNIPSIRIPPPPPAAAEGAAPTSGDVADIFGRASEEGLTGY